jgi:regulator of Ty1 transposition protein 109
MLDGEVGDGVVLSREGYDKAMQTLLHLDFSTREAAGNSTSKWVSDVSAVGGFQAGWAMEVVGTAPVQASTATTAGVNGEKRGEKVNDLGSMVRKKRKVEDGGDGANGKENGNGPAVNVLGAGMVRKKVKATS